MFEVQQHSPTHGPTPSHDIQPPPGGVPYAFDENSDGLSFAREDALVLIVDDEHEVVEEIAEKLEMHGYRCLTAMDAEMGLEIFSSLPNISIIIADIRMPGMDGLELCRIIKKKTFGERDIALLIITGHAGLPEAVEALKVGALDFLTKPISPDFLLHAVKRAVHHVNACALEREFKERLKAEVAAKTAELQDKANELEVANTKLMLANQVKDEFLAMISHELRTPLNAIVGFASVIEHDLTNPDQREFIGKIKNAGWQLTEMINSMIDMVAVETKTLKLNLSEVSIADLIKQTIEVYRSQSEKNGVSIEANKVHAITATLDGLRISQAVGRLIDNAIKFSPEGGVIRVSAQQTGDTLAISVWDDGPGISEEDQKKALQPLRQVDGSTTRKCGGIGVGLSLARMFAVLHGGGLTIDSISGQGTAVTITLPM